MNLSTHVAVGAAVGYLSKNPALGFAAGFISHHLIDAVPHTDGGSLNVFVGNFAKDKRILTIVAVDMIILLGIAWLAFGLHGFNQNMIWGMFGGALPDLIDNMPFWAPKLRKVFPTNYYHRLHEFLHFTITNQKYFLVGILTQVILILAAFKLLV